MPATKTYFYANGKRKTAIARVRLYPGGSGEMIINEKPAKEYFSNDEMVGCMLSPLSLLGQEKGYDVSIRVVGGGLSSQAEACRHGIARALVESDSALRGQMKVAGFLTRDARIKERKKPGLKRARRAPQWSKR